MSVTDITLFYAPQSCARVPTIALEEIGVPFDIRLVRFMKGEHKSPDYKQHNPKGKVPCVLIDGESLTENVAILSYLNERFPEAQLLPATNDTLSRYQQIADLSFCAATLHPIVTRIRRPTVFSKPEHARAVWESGCDAMNEYFTLIDQRLRDASWWYGEDWSVMDAYLYWVFWRVEGADFDVSAYPNYRDHARRIEQRPSVQRALAREAEAEKQLEAEGLTFTPPPLPG
ncbi:MAG: glutathione S-transferase family protein [Pseudomonadales bacterium]